MLEMGITNMTDSVQFMKVKEKETAIFESCGIPESLYVWISHQTLVKQKENLIDVSEESQN
jgi:hypothetical protein